ncbi:MAG: SPFH domain-containing protein [Planctomycetota bacterium]
MSEPAPLVPERLPQAAPQAAPAAAAPAVGGPAVGTPAREDAAGEALEEAVGLALTVLKGVTVLLVLAFLGSGMFTVSSNEVAFIRRLGVQDETPLEAGLHWRWQVIDEVVRVDKRPRTLVSDRFDLARTAKDVTHEEGPSREGGVNPTRDGYLLTGDVNVVHVALATRLAPREPYLRSRTRFHEGNPDPVLEALLDRAVVHAAAYRKVDALLGGGKGAFLEGVKRELAASLERVEAGFEIQGVDLERDLAASPQVRDAFAKVTQASQEVDKQRSEAQGAATRLENEAIVEAARVESEAQARAQQLAADAGATRKEFEALLPSYRADPAAVRQRLLARALAEALQQVGESFLVGHGELRVKLERDTRAERAELRAKARERLGVGGE